MQYILCAQKSCGITLGSRSSSFGFNFLVLSGGVVGIVGAESPYEGRIQHKAIRSKVSFFISSGIGFFAKLSCVLGFCNS